MSDFWARRKAAVLAEENEATRIAKAEEQAEREAALAARTDEEILSELALPDPDTLEAGDDFKVFLTEAVPARIRTRALRRLWRLNPVLANVDGLVDYGEDFTDAACVVENLQTAYQVGKGMTEHVREMMRRAEEDAAKQDGDDEIEDEDTLPHETLDPKDNAPDLVAESAAPSPALPVDYDTAESTAAFTPSRRMRFTFETQTDAPESGARA